MLDLSRGYSTVIVSAFLCVSVTTTLARYNIKRRKGTQGLEDTWIVVALGWSLAMFIVFLAASWSAPHEMASKPRLLTFYRLGFASFQSTSLWSARMSVAMVIVRFSGDPFKRIAKAASAVFAFLWFFHLIPKIVVCATAQLHSICQVPRLVGYLTLGSDLLADAWLIMAPMLLFRSQGLAYRLQRVVVSVFFCNIFTVTATLVHLYCVLNQGSGELEITTGHVQATVCITVSNLLIVLPCIRRWAQRAQIQEHVGFSMGTLVTPGHVYDIRNALEFSVQDTEAPIQDLTHLTIPH